MPLPQEPETVVDLLVRQGLASGWVVKDDAPVVLRALQLAGIRDHFEVVVRTRNGVEMIGFLRREEPF